MAAPVEQVVEVRPMRPLGEAEADPVLMQPLIDRAGGGASFGACEPVADGPGINAGVRLPIISPRSGILTV